jgi:hypothetical protein
MASLKLAGAHSSIAKGDKQLSPKQLFPFPSQAEPNIAAVQALGHSASLLDAKLLIF